MIQYIVVIGLLLLLQSVYTWYKGREGFEGQTKFHESPYDSEYAGISKQLWHPYEKLQFESVSFQDIALADWPVASVKVVDLACGVAPQACWFKNLGVEYTGADSSSDMLEKARKDCPSAKFKKCDITQAACFPLKSFSHAFILGFSIYEFANPKIVFDNANAWLQPGGYLVVHMVDPDKYDALLDLASPFAAFSLQKYSSERQTKSEIYFNDFKYIGELKKKPDEDDAVFAETMVYFDPADGIKYREQKHDWYMPSVERMIEIAKTSGFRLKEKVHLVACAKEYQYLVYFTK